MLLDPQCLCIKAVPWVGVGLVAERGWGWECSVKDHVVKQVSRHRVGCQSTPGCGQGQLISPLSLSYPTCAMGLLTIATTFKPYEDNTEPVKELGTEKAR